MLEVMDLYHEFLRIVRLNKCSCSKYGRSKPACKGERVMRWVSK